jgi:hypothetical protein
MTLKYSIGLLSLIACTVMIFTYLGGKNGEVSAVPKDSQFRANRQRELLSASRSDPSAGLASPAPAAATAHAAAPDFRSPSMEKRTPLEIWSDRSAALASKRKNPAARPDGDNPPPAIRLSDDFRLPASILATAAQRMKPSAAALPAPIEAASEVLTAKFYQSLAGEASLDEGSESTVEIDPATGQMTRVIEPDATTDRIRKQSDELYRSLFGNEAYNQFLRQSAIERNLPPAEPSFSTD